MKPKLADLFPFALHHMTRLPGS